MTTLNLLSGPLYLPPEVLQNIVSHLAVRDDALGRGVGMTSLNVALISRGFYAAQNNQFAQVPQHMQKQGTVDKLDGDGNPVPDRRGQTRQVDIIALVDVVTLTGPALHVGELLVWRDLDEAYACVMANLRNDNLWLQLRLITLDFVDNYVTGTDFDTCRHTGYFYKKAHWVFIHLADIYRRLYFSLGGHSLQCIVIKPIDWNSIRSMDVAGMLGLSLLPAVDVRFISPVLGRRVGSYIKPEVREAIQKRACRTRYHEWEPTSLEDPCPRKPWKERALASRRVGETEGDCLLRFLRVRYAEMFRL